MKENVFIFFNNIPLVYSTAFECFLKGHYVLVLSNSVGWSLCNIYSPCGHGFSAHILSVSKSKVIRRFMKFIDISKSASRLCNNIGPQKKNRPTFSGYILVAYSARSSLRSPVFLRLFIHFIFYLTKYSCKDWFPQNQNEDSYPKMITGDSVGLVKT